MAATHRLEATMLSSIDGVSFTALSGHRSFSSSLEKSINVRDSPNEGRVMLLGGGKPSAASQNGELQPMMTAVLLDLVSVIDLKPYQLDLHRVINAAAGAPIDDPQSRPLKACGVEELKRVRQCLVENEKQARLRIKHLSEAMAKLNKIQNMLQTRKQSRPESSTQEQASLAVASSGHMTTTTHGKVSSSAVPNHVSTLDIISGASRAGDKNKNGTNPNKRVRTSIADVRLEGRPNHLSVQRSSSIIQEREQDVPRPSSSLALQVEDKESMPLGTNQGGEKVKLKGRRSSVKSEVSPVVAVANGTSDGEHDHKWTTQHQRLSLDSSRSRPSEGHGYRSGPVHGVTSIYKAEVSAQANSLSMRGLSKGDSDGVTPGGERGDRLIFSEREHNTLKNEVRASSQEEAHPASLPIVMKAKSARAPRSSFVSGTNPSGFLSRTSPLPEVQDRTSIVTTTTKVELSSGPSHRKRPVPSRSSSPPVAQWGIQRPQKARLARRPNLNPPVGILIPSRDEVNGADENAMGMLEGNGSSSTLTGPRATTPVAIGASSLAHRINVSSSQSLLQTKADVEESVSVGPLERDDSDKNVEKAKEKDKKAVPKLGETKMVTSSQKSGCVLSSTNKSHAVLKEEGVQGDGVRRQGRTGRGSVTARVTTTPAISPPTETCDVVPVNAKQLRSLRATSDTKPNRPPGRPPLKKENIDRKPATRQWQELSGEFDDDREELVHAIQSAVDFSAEACSVGFWKEVEPYFAYLTSADIWYLHQQTRGLEIDNTALQVPSNGDQLLKVEMIQSSDTPAVSLNPELGCNKSMGRVNGSNGSDGGSTAGKLQRDEKTGCIISGRQGFNVGFLDKFSLSQRLMSAFINVLDIEKGDERRTSSEEAFRDESFRQSHLQDSELSPLHPGGQSGSMDFDGGESDGDFGCLGSECWSQGMKERGHCEAVAGLNGHTNKRIGLMRVKGDDPGDGDNILVNPEGEYCADKANNENFLFSKECNQGSVNALEMTAWELQYYQMSLDDRLMLELQSIRVLPLQWPNLPQQEDDEICDELMKLQFKLKEQVCTNIEQITCLERAVQTVKGSEERAREYLAMNKLVERAYTRRMDSRCSKGPPVKGARSAALAFAKRVISKVRSFEAGHSCIVDLTLRDLLFCVPRKTIKASIDKAQQIINSEEAPVLPSVNSPALNPAIGAQWAGQKVERDSVVDNMSPRAPTKHITTKDEVWPIRAKKREALLEAVSGWGINCQSGDTKGKHSERDCDGKGGSVRDGNITNIQCSESSRLGNVNKGERKTKMKSRQKNRPLLKPVNGLFAKSLTEERVSNDRAVSEQISTPKLVSFVEESIPRMPVAEELGLGMMNVDGIVDISQLPLPGMDEMTVADMGAQVQDDISSWFDFDDPLQPSDELVMGLDVPMDDLSDLGMMM